ncbi:SMI1/KNR4 family protein [Streptomyces nodosus]|uniref:SMI1/KNR4 family protein n=1 Tax=Streptomyces nodosus TaxID=40318 RepID=UPI0034557347
MTTQDSLETLMRLMPPRPGDGLTVDWAAVEAAWGLEFPPDFKGFVARYGEDFPDEDLSVIVPTEVTPQTCDEPGAPMGGMGFITADARATWAITEPTGLDAVPEDLVAWGAASSADLYCWLTQGEPADWPVVVFSHGDDTWTRFGYGMTEFLCRVIQADAGVQPMHDIPLWGRSVS